jgi:hypothetical protein
VPRIVFFVVVSLVAAVVFFVVFLAIVPLY